VDFAASGANALTLTGHKVGGPYGVGALLLDRDTPCVPLLHGGGQEREVRSGTLDVPAIHAFATAVRASVRGRAGHVETVGGLRDELIEAVLREVPDAVLNGARPGRDRLPGNAHFTFPGCAGDSLLMLLDAKGIECSTGSACTAGVAQPSHVLLAMGADAVSARGSLRFSLGHSSTRADVEALAKEIGGVVGRARQAGLSGLRKEPGGQPAARAEV
jgi:cysteine desulfurase